MIICIGNALVDSLTQIEESKIDDLKLNKARMTLVNKDRSNFLLENMNDPISVSYTHLTLPTKRSV